MILKLSKSAEGLKIPPVRQNDLYILWYVQYNSLSNWHATHFCILFLTVFCPLPIEKRNLHKEFTLFFTRFVFSQKSQVQHQSLSSDLRNKGFLQLIYSPKYNLDK